MHRPPRFYCFISERMEKNKPIKRTKQFISPIKNIPANVLTCYQCFKLMSLDFLSMILLPKNYLKEITLP